jgi:hypothetical protein
MMARLHLGLLFAAGFVMASPAAAQPTGTLACAVGKMTPEVRANFRSLYASKGINLTSKELIPPDLAAAVGSCLPPGADRNERHSQLVAGLMTYELMQVTSSALILRHAVSEKAIEAAWGRLSAADRIALLAPAQRKGRPTSGESRDVVFRFAEMAHPGTSAERLRSQPQLAQDFIVYAISRATVEDLPR